MISMDYKFLFEDWKSWYKMTFKEMMTKVYLQFIDLVLLLWLKKELWGSYHKRKNFGGSIFLNLIKLCYFCGMGDLLNRGYFFGSFSL